MLLLAMDVASAFTKSCKLLSRQNIVKQKNPSLQIVMRTTESVKKVGAGARV